MSEAITIPIMTGHLEDVSWALTIQLKSCPSYLQYAFCMQLCQLEKVCSPLWISPVKLLGTNIQDGAMAREGKEVYQYRPLLSKAIRKCPKQK
jgi:hypothetical protein